MQDYSRSIVGFVALKFSKLIAEKLFNGTSMTYYLAFMPVTNKVGQRSKIHFKIFIKKYNRRLTRVVKNLYFKSFFE